MSFIWLISVFELAVNSTQIRLWFDHGIATRRFVSVRKQVPQRNHDKKISLQFIGLFTNSLIWVNIKDEAGVLTE